MTADVVEKVIGLRSKVDEYKESYSENIRKTFSFSDLEFNDNIVTLDGVIFSDKAKNNLFGMFQAKKDFNLKKRNRLLSEVDIANVMNTVKKVNTNGRLYAMYDNLSEPNEITNLYLLGENNRINSETFLDYDKFFDSLLDKLTTTELDFTEDTFSLDTTRLLNGITFDEKTGQININLLNDSTFDVIEGNTGISDLWRPGVNITFNPFTTKTSPYMSRLVCSNGMTVAKYGKALSMDQNKFNYVKLNKMLENFLIKGDFLEVGNDIKERVQIAKNVNLTVNELLQLSKYSPSFAQLLENQKFNESRRYSLDKYEGSYNTLLEDMSERFKQTAAIEATVYDTVNDITWAAQRYEDYDLDLKQSNELKIISSNLLLKSEYDLENIAPRIYSLN